MNDLQGIPEFIQNPITWLICAWILREAWALAMKSAKEHQEANKEFKVDVTGALKENSEKLATMTIALIKLESKLDSMSQLVMLVPKLTQDVSILFERIKLLSPETE